MVSAGVACHIGQGFLRDAVGGGGKGVTDFVDPVMGERARRAGSFLKVRRAPIEGGNEPQVVEYPGPEANGHPPDLVDGLVDQLAHGEGPFRGFGVETLQALPDPHHIDAQGREDLAEFIMQFPGNGHALLFLAADHAGREFSQLILGPF